MWPLIKKKGFDFLFKKILGTFIVASSILLMASPSFAYTVKSGDTLSQIASEQEMSLSEIIKINPQINNPNLIFIGENISTSENNQYHPVTQVENESTEVSGSLSAAEHDLLARLVKAEAQSESYKGKVAVAEVVLNRVSSSAFPDSVTSVIYQHGQFSPVTNGTINNVADSESIRAVKDSLGGTNLTNGALFFYNPHIVTSWLDSRPTVAVIGNHVFKK